jgi:hypothetical protein
MSVPNTSKDISFGRRRRGGYSIHRGFPDDDLVSNEVAPPSLHRTAKGPANAIASKHRVSAVETVIDLKGFGKKATSSMITWSEW